MSTWGYVATAAWSVVTVAALIMSRRLWRNETRAFDRFNRAHVRGFPVAVFCRAGLRALRRCRAPGRVEPERLGATWCPWVVRHPRNGRLRAVVGDSAVRPAAEVGASAHAVRRVGERSDRLSRRKH